MTSYTALAYLISLSLPLVPLLMSRQALRQLRPQFPEAFRLVLVGGEPRLVVPHIGEIALAAEMQVLGQKMADVYYTMVDGYERVNPGALVRTHEVLHAANSDGAVFR